MNKQLTIGRDVSCNIQIKNDSEGRVSRHHATISITGQQMMLEDHSTNGTRVNGQSIHHSRIAIQQGDEILLGNSVRLSWDEINRLLPKQKAAKKRWPVVAIAVSVAVMLVIVGIIVVKNGQCKIYTSGNYEWDGNCSNGLADGTGTITWHSGKKYEGEVSKGHITGRGIEYLHGTMVFDGEFLDGQWKHGTYYASGYARYSGEISNNKANGYGTSYYPQSYEIARKGFFANDRFLNEDEADAQRFCREMAHKIVYNVFRGGDNIRYDLRTYIINRERTSVEMIFDLKFNGNWRSSNFYQCRVRVRYPGEPSYEFIDEYSNDNVKDWLRAYQFFDDVETVASIAGNIIRFFQ